MMQNTDGTILLINFSNVSTLRFEVYETVKYVNATLKSDEKTEVLEVYFSLGRILN